MPATNARSNASESATIEARSIIAARTFDAPRDLVFSLWTDHHHLANWWGPNGFSITTQEFDFRPGGAWRFVMHGPDGTDYKNHIVYAAIERPDRIVYDHVTGPLFHATATFNESGGKTTVRVQMIFETAESRDRVAREHGAVEGLKQTLGRLAEEVAKAAAADSASTAKQLTMTRIFNAPRELVFQAFTEAKHVANWWGPNGFTNPVCEWDAKPGNAIRVDMRAPDGTVFPMGGVFLEVVPPERLVFTTTAMHDDQGRPQLENRNTITFEEQDGKTKMTLNAVVLRATAAAAGALSGMEVGWKQTLDRLDAEVSHMTNGTTIEDFVITRAFDAPRELVWKAFTESDRLAQWFGPKGATVFHSKTDLRPGGVYHYGMRMPDGIEVWGKWVYRDIVAPERLVVVSSFSDKDGGVTRHPFAGDWPREMLSTFTFDEHQGKTLITIRWSPLNATPAEIATFDNARSSMVGGWTGTFEQLEKYLANAS